MPGVQSFRLRVSKPSPMSFSDCWAWYDAADTSTLYKDPMGLFPVESDGDTVGRWLDKSGNLRAITQSSPAARPPYTIGVQSGLPALLFDGARYLDGVEPVESFPLTILGVAKRTATAGATQGLVSLYHSTLFGSRVALTSGNLVQSVIATPSSARNSSASVSANSSFLFGARFDSTTNTNVLNDVLTAPLSHTASAVTNILSIGRINTNTAANLANAYICEVLIYSRALSDTEIGQLSSYLNSKWAVY